MRIGIIAASEAEINPLLAVMRETSQETHAMLRFHVGMWGSHEIVALYCGVCKVNAALATQLLIDRYQVDRMIMTGVAGAIDPTLRIGDTVIASEAAYHDVVPAVLQQYHPYLDSVYFPADVDMVAGLQEAAHAGPYAANTTTGRMVTGEAFIEQEGRQQIIDAHHPLCVDMESAAMAHVCYVNSIPFAVVRSISDTPAESGMNTFEENCDMAAKRSVALLQTYLDAL